ncbi:MAG: hypothetical protein WC136_07790 [Sphaerochaeta sp.]
MIISSERSCFKETREAGNRAKRDMVQHLDIHFWTQNVLRKFPTFAEFVSWLDCKHQCLRGKVALEDVWRARDIRP